MSTRSGRTRVADSCNRTTMCARFVACARVHLAAATSRMPPPPQCVLEMDEPDTTTVEQWQAWQECGALFANQPPAEVDVLAHA